MGSWSVYCGISQIAITAGRKCVLLPLKKSTSYGSYLPYLPATLPIFGEYDDYGGIENIVEDENTKLIEEHFNCTIHEFCYFFTRGQIRDDEEDFPKKLKKNKEIKDWNFMFIDLDVYNFISSNCEGYEGKGHLDYGNPSILKLLGFTLECESTSPVLNKSREPKRYNQIWKLCDKELYSDGTRANTSDGQGIYYFIGKSNSLEKFLGEIPEDKKWIGEKSMWQLYEYLDYYTVAEKLFWIIGGKNNLFRSSFDKFKPEEVSEMMTLLGKDDEVSIKRVQEIKNKASKRKTIIPLIEKYTRNIPYFNKLLSDLVTIRYNLHCMSGYFAPYILYLTPQCGEYSQHQVLLEKFAEINKGIMKERGYDDVDDEDE